LAMQLAMAFWVKKLAIRCTVRATQHLRDDVVAVPVSLPCDGFATADALVALLSPEIEQRSTTCECLGHRVNASYRSAYIGDRHSARQQHFVLATSAVTAPAY
jgi:hypothetical protein